MTLFPFRGGLAVISIVPASYPDESGQDMLEYGLVAAIVAVGVIASVRSVQTAIVNAAYTGISIDMLSF